MKDFKLIAIRPLAGCDKKFSKVLSEGVPYIFYNEYDFSEYTDESNILRQRETKTLDLYSVKNNFNKEIKINISAIVGQNGSGKSSLVELFYVACYNISVIKEVLFEEEEERLLKAKDIVPNISVEFFYKIDDDIFKLKLKQTEIKVFKLQGNKFVQIKNTDFDLNDFFYTISINYSLHSLNTKVLGDWVKRIFHKNDGYQTPIVLNPYRKNGNIEINNEEYLVKNRLISNILGKTNRRTKAKESLRNILDKKIAHRLIIELNRDKFTYDKNDKPIFKITEEIGELILPLVYKHFLKNENFEPEDTLLNRYAKEYILYKLKSIASKYQPYKENFLDFYTDARKTDKFLSLLARENSHVTFKLTQAINFLSNELYFKRKETFNLTVAYLSNQLDKESKNKSKELIDILPPAFFKVDIEFKDSDTFDLLSSGEKQRIYSIATLIYHLSNLSSTNEEIVKLKYKRVNIIFDELELYFHPELQRSLINDIVESIKKINLTNIDALNILLITHSPFILSDIPDSNILFLTESGLPEEKRDNIKTFGGNIHELLAHSFFLNNGLIGEFAKNRIQGIIDNLNPDKNVTRKKVASDLIWDEIQIIGEPFLKEKLEEMYYVKFDKEKRINQLRAELDRLEND
ncbi:AAA family ATPase [Flagellimonas lutimaris]|uniref:AAA family ATPase n=1 Tax=Flagellimonas lutimaris TaxID=475082 RepID=UPI0039C07237